jgi:hypothetical protein
LNKELLRLKVKFEILTVRSKIPTIESIILTTSEEIHKFKQKYKKLYILPYNNEENFDHYVLKILAAYKIGYKERYSVLVFSIDPGTKQIGIVIFLDDYYLQSHTIYNKEAFIEVINDYLLCFQNIDSNPFTLIFKFGKGVISATTDLLEIIFDTPKTKKNMKVYLIDESNTSKLRILDNKKHVKTKHEASALIIAMRKGIKVDSSNYLLNIRQNSIQKNNHQGRGEDNWEDFQEKKLKLKKIIERVLNNEISLSRSSELVRNLNIRPKRYYRRKSIKRIQF